MQQRCEGVVAAIDNLGLAQPNHDKKAHRYQEEEDTSEVPGGGRHKHTRRRGRDGSASCCTTAIIFAARLSHSGDDAWNLPVSHVRLHGATGCAGAC